MVVHIALSYIIKKTKNEPANARIKRLLESFRTYAFNLPLTLSDFPSRTKVDKSNSQEIISVDVQEVLQEKYYMHTRSGAKQKQELLKERYTGMINTYSLT